ncbi:MAG: endonuclease [Ignavibacteriales bacterium]|nr:endonuclease [Ignavibacteriales bacterium]
MSREHTYCHSWQPTNPSTALDEYSDQHHLFPSHQNSANGIRDNHPLGKVANVISTFLDGKFGTDLNGNLVYEPRDLHKGDAVRALLYMVVRYDGINGFNWTFDWLNNTRLPSIGEGPQDLSTLIEWHKQDPPDKWEVDRNNYVQSVQQNRNPFVDHPEYVDYINFNNLTTLFPVFAAEPENYVTSFTGSSSNATINFNWTDALSGSQEPSNYLLIIYNKNDFFIPIDGQMYVTDTNISDGRAIVNIPYSGADTFHLTGVTENASYYATIFSYNGSGSLINYKIDGTVPSLVVQTNSGGGGLSDLFISEYVEGTSNNKALEFYNGTANPINLTSGNYTVEMYFNGSTSASSVISLTGTINDNDVFVLANSSAVTAILAVADQTNGSAWYNGDDAIVLKKNGIVIDAIGQIGFDPGTEWGSGLTSTADNTLRRKSGVITGDTNPNDAFDPSLSWNGFVTDTFSGLGTPDPLPVELTSFSAATIGSTVKLNWQTATELNNYGFEVERCALSAERQAWDKIGFVNGNGNSNSPKDYSFVDDFAGKPAYRTGRYSYRLKQIDNDGQFEYSKTINVDFNGVKKFELSQNYPNPFNPTTTIRFNLPEAGNVKLTLFNILGQELRTLVNEYKESGVHTINFDASDLNSGMYIYKIETGAFVQTRKMTLIK